MSENTHDRELLKFIAARIDAERDRNPDATEEETAKSIMASMDDATKRAALTAYLARTIELFQIADERTIQEFQSRRVLCSVSKVYVSEIGYTVEFNEAALDAEVSLDGRSAHENPWAEGRARVWRDGRLLTPSEALAPEVQLGITQTVRRVFERTSTDSLNELFRIADEVVAENTASH